MCICHKNEIYYIFSLSKIYLGKLYTAMDSKDILKILALQQLLKTGPVVVDKLPYLN